MKPKKFVFKVKHLKYINRKIENATSGQLLEFVVDTFNYQPTMKKKTTNFRNVICFDFMVELAHRYKVSYHDMFERIPGCALQKYKGERMTLDFKTKPENAQNWLERPKY